ncbi:hypothetical protein LJR296_008232 [Cupriavidus necator]|uniref:hypothetical protein n=1 Tax=Cupriavidus necator TaxID=106590 RepID=UPI003ECF005C
MKHGHGDVQITVDLAGATAEQLARFQADALEHTNAALRAAVGDSMATITIHLPPPNEATMAAVNKPKTIVCVVQDASVLKSSVLANSTAQQATQQ